MGFGDILEAANQYGSHQWVGKSGNGGGSTMAGADEGSSDSADAAACDCGNSPAHTMGQHKAIANSAPAAK